MRKPTSWQFRNVGDFHKALHWPIVDPAPLAPTERKLRRWDLSCISLLAPKASEASWGLSYFCQGVLSGYCCVCVSGYCCVWERGYFNWVCCRGAVVRLFDSDWLLLIWSYIITKAWSVDHTIIVIYINGVCYEGTPRGLRGPKNTEYLSLYNRCASRICTLWL